MSRIKSTEIEGDASVGRHLITGGDVTIQGNALVKKNLRVEGWLDARNIKTVNKGLFSTEGFLLASYPAPRVGWFAGVLATTEDIRNLGLTTEKDKALFRMYIGHNGKWHSIDKLYEIVVDNVIDYSGDIDKLKEQIENLKTSPLPTSISLEELDTMGTDGSREALLALVRRSGDNMPVCVYSVMQGRYLVGSLFLFSDSMGHVLTQMLESHCVFEDGILNTSSHTDAKITRYFRSYNLSSPSLEVERDSWTPWMPCVADSSAGDDPSISPSPAEDAAILPLIPCGFERIADAGDGPATNHVNMTSVVTSKQVEASSISHIVFSSDLQRFVLFMDGLYYAEWESAEDFFPASKLYNNPATGRALPAKPFYCYADDKWYLSGKDENGLILLRSMAGDGDGCTCTGLTPWQQSYLNDLEQKEVQGKFTVNVSLSVTTDEFDGEPHYHTLYVTPMYDGKAVEADVVATSNNIISAFTRDASGHYSASVKTTPSGYLSSSGIATTFTAKVTYQHPTAGKMEKSVTARHTEQVYSAIVASPTEPSLEDIQSAKIRKSSLSGNHTIEFNEGDYIYFVGVGSTIKEVKSNGFAVPLSDDVGSLNAKVGQSTVAYRWKRTASAPKTSPMVVTIS